MKSVVELEIAGPLQVPGISLHVELERLVDAGLTPLEASPSSPMADSVAGPTSISFWLQPRGWISIEEPRMAGPPDGRRSLSSART